MAKRPAGEKSDRSDPKKNRSLAIRMVLKTMPKAKASDVAAAVKKEFGHAVKPNMIYMVKTKTNMASNNRASKQGTKNVSPMNTAARWVDAIRVARSLLKATGSVANATALLKAVDG